MGCPYYSGCLDHSINEAWESFSCLQCPIGKVANELPKELGKYATQRKGDRYG